MSKTTNFGEALEAAKQGHIIRRKHWIGGSVTMEPGSIDHSGVQSDNSKKRGLEASFRIVSVEGVKSELFRPGDHGTVTRMPHLRFVNERGTTETGWTPTQADMLASDWVIIGGQDNGEKRCGCRACTALAEQGGLGSVIASAIRKNFAQQNFSDRDIRSAEGVMKNS